MSVVGKILDVASAWSLASPPIDAQAPAASARTSAPNPFATPSRGPSVADLSGLLNATSFIGVPEYSRLFKGSSPTAIAGARTRSAPGGVVATSKESIVRSYCARLRAAAWPAALPCAFGGVPNPV